MTTLRPALSALSGLVLFGSFVITAQARGETHDGFYFNGQLGFGGSAIVAEREGVPDVEFNNGNGDFSFDLGGALSQNVLLFGRFWSVYQANPNAETAGVEIDLDDDVTVYMAAVAIGARYYFMPINLYAGASLGLARFGIEADGDNIADSDYGFAIQLEVGKEWWVDADWAIGVGGRFSHAAADTEQEAGSVTGDALSVLFTATYN
jgi:hypothetical protein